MSLTINTKTYVPDSFGVNTVTYTGPGNTVSLLDIIRLARTRPKPTPLFSGLGRTQAKMTRTLPLTGSLTPTGDAIFDAQVAVPVGFSSADVDALLDDVGSYISSDEFKAQVKNQKISF